MNKLLFPFSVGLLSVLIFLLLNVSCRSTKGADADNVITFDWSKNYPKKKLHIDDVADVQYIAFNDSVMLGSEGAYSQVDMSDDLIVFNEGSNVYTCDRSGELLYKFNRSGRSREEYIGIDKICVDFNAERIYILDNYNERIQVYSFKGDFLNSLRDTRWRSCNDLLEYDTEYLLARMVTYNECLKEYQASYYWMDKIDGGLDTITAIKTQAGITENFRFEHNNMVVMQGKSGDYIPFVRYGDTVIVSEISSDTIYKIKNREFYPYIVKSPKVEKSDEQVIVVLFQVTPQYTFFLKNQKGGYSSNTYYAMDNKSKDFFEVEFIELSSEDLYAKGRNMVKNYMAKVMPAGSIDAKNIHLDQNLKSFFEENKDRDFVRVMKFK